MAPLRILEKYFAEDNDNTSLLESAPKPQLQHIAVQTDETLDNELRPRKLHPSQNQLIDRTEEPAPAPEYSNLVESVCYDALPDYSSLVNSGYFDDVIPEVENAIEEVRVIEEWVEAGIIAESAIAAETGIEAVVADTALESESAPALDLAEEGNVIDLAARAAESESAPALDLAEEGNVIDVTAKAADAQADLEYEFVVDEHSEEVLLPEMSVKYDGVPRTVIEDYVAEVMNADAAFKSAPAAFEIVTAVGGDTVMEEAHMPEMSVENYGGPGTVIEDSGVAEWRSRWTHKLKSKPKSKSKLQLKETMPSWKKST